MATGTPAASGSPVPQGTQTGAPLVETAPSFSESSAFVLWSKYEDVAMHFNDLIMKLRTQALAGLAGVVTVSGLAVSFTGKAVTATEWEVLFYTIAFLTLAWIALFSLDLCYYNKLLMGAVKAIHKHEELTDNEPPIERIILSRHISGSAVNHTKVVCFFYGLVFLGLLVGDAFTLYKWCTMPTTPSASSKYEFKFERAPAEGVDVKIAPTHATDAPPQTPTSKSPSTLLPSATPPKANKTP
jgi:hypothetical protein